MKNSTGSPALFLAVDEVFRLARLQEQNRSGPWYNPRRPEGPDWYREGNPTSSGVFATWNGFWCGIHYWTGTEWRHVLWKESALSRTWPQPTMWKEMPERVRLDFESRLEEGQRNALVTRSYRKEGANAPRAHRQGERPEDLPIPQGPAEPAGTPQGEMQTGIGSELQEMVQLPLVAPTTEHRPE